MSTPTSNNNNNTITTTIEVGVASTDGSYCPHFHHVIELIGRRWTGAILLVLSSGPSRFSGLRHQIPGLSDRLLSERLDELEDEGIVEHRELNDHTFYQLSQKGAGLLPVIHAIETFAQATAGDQRRSDRPGRRAEKGSPVHQR